MSPSWHPHQSEELTLYLVEQLEERQFLHF